LLPTSMRLRKQSARFFG